MQSWLIGFTVLYNVAVLTPIIPQTSAADNQPPGGKQWYEVAAVCAERYRPAWVLQPLEAHGLVIGIGAPMTIPARMLFTEEGLIELQVPAALLTALPTVPRESPPGELQVPAALLTVLQTDGLGTLP
jgi:hypothetical protein